MASAARGQRYFRFLGGFCLGRGLSSAFASLSGVAPSKWFRIADMIPNWKNQTIWTADNLDVLRGMNSESVDLIYLDPPFNSNRNYSAPIGSEAAGAAFKDTWTLSDVDLAWIGIIAEREPNLASVIDAAGLAHGKSMQSYLVMMAVRLLEMRRVLQPAGSIYLHCDPTANAYLRMLCDVVFGARCFRSEIVWRRSNVHNKTRKQYGPIHDTLLFYALSDSAVFSPGTRPYSRTYIEARFKRSDAMGRYQTNYLTGPGTRDGESGEEWRGFDPTASGRHWAVPKSLRRFLPNEGAGMGSHEKLDRLHEQGLIVFPKKPGGQPMYKQYIGPGVPYQDVWAYQPNTSGILFDSSEHIDQDVKWIEVESEKTGYPTQKPLGLLERVIRTSSNEGDMVLDPFCGCATALVAAEKLCRQWAGIDISPKAAELVKVRMDRETNLFDQFNPIVRTDIPRRTDVGKLPPYKTHRHTLYGKQEGHCAGCGHHFPFRNLTVDHIVPKSKGGTDHLDNLQLLCGACNSMKGTISQAAFVAKLKKEGIGE